MENVTGKATNAADANSDELREYFDASTNGSMPTNWSVSSAAESVMGTSQDWPGMVAAMGTDAVSLGAAVEAPVPSDNGAAVDVADPAVARNGSIERDNGKENPRDEKKIKLSLEVTPELNRVIEHIADATGATKSEAIRKAIVLMEVAVEAKENGERLYVGTQPPPGASREIIGL